MTVLAGPREFPWGSWREFEEGTLVPICDQSDPDDN